jgi:hypothetical protein
MFRWSVTLIGTNSLKTTLNFMIPQALYVDADAAALQLLVALQAVTDANVYSETLTEIRSGSTALPADADVTDEALVITYLSGTGEAAKYHPIRIPAPIAGMFLGDLVTVDITNQPLQDWVAELSQHVEVSDGESIVLDIDEGIASGYWRSVKKLGR